MLGKVRLVLGALWFDWVCIHDVSFSNERKLSIWIQIGDVMNVSVPEQKDFLSWLFVR